MKSHYYNLTFVENTPDGLVYANTYVGIETQQMTLPIIKNAQLKAKLTHESTLIACSYLGHMTAEEFRG